MTAPPLANLINELTKLPGVGGKSAARLAYYILKRPAAEAEAQAEQIRAAASVEALRLRSDNAAAYAQHPALLRLQELESLAVLSRNAQARIYIGFDKHQADSDD